MKKTMMGFALTAAMIVPAIIPAIVPTAYAEVPIDRFEEALKAGNDYGISHYKEFEFDDDGSVEIEGWIDKDWFVEIDVSGNGEVIHEERKRRKDGPWGMQDAEVRQTIEAAKTEGMTRLEEINISSGGQIEVEGEDDSGKEIELKKNRSERQPG